MNDKKVNLNDKLYNFLSTSFTNIYIQRIFILSVSFLLIFLIVITPVYFFLDSKSYDLFMTNIKRPIKQDDSLLLIDIDDNVMEELKTWPITRNYHGDAIEVLADFGAKAAIFDIEFIEPSRIEADIDRINKTKNELANKLQSVLDVFVKESADVVNNPSRQKNLENLWNTFNVELSDYYLQTNDSLDNIPIYHDEYFTNRLRYFGKAFGTVNMLYDFNLEGDQKSIKKQLDESMIFLEKYGFKKEILLKNRKSHPSIINANISDFPIETILNNFVNIGFTKVERDKDGALRNIPLFMEMGGYVIPQLGFRPFLDLYNIKREQIDLSSSNHVILRDVQIDANKKVTIKIPIYNKWIDKKNKNKKIMRINWPSGDFLKIFPYNKQEVIEKKEEPQHFSYMNLLYYKNVLFQGLEDKLNKLIMNLEKIEKYKDECYFLLEYLRFKNEKERIIKTQVLNEGLRISMNQYLDDYLMKLKGFTSEEYIKIKGNEIDNIIKAKKFSGPTKDQWLQLKNEIRIIMEAISNDVKNILFFRDNLKILKDKICFIGLTATGTTDMGATPFDKTFENVGTHPSVFNTILQRNFIRIIPIWLIFIFTVLLFGGIIWLLSPRKSTFVASIGFTSTFIVVICMGIFYYFTNIYISPVIPFLFGFISFVIMIMLKFIISEKDKGYIRNAFNKYLSPEYVEAIIKDKKKLELDGIRANCTAIFTDIQGFSSISEQFMEDPKGLVSLLKEYLSAMSDIILQNGGIIDKYEGDAILAFFGEPVKMEDHALQACLSSIRMKQIEKQLNKKILDEKIIDTPLLTRIGINTGDMFIGNMGTDKKMNYTMMGHAVNLAARLEGVNKQYGIYQLISENTYQHIKDKITTRKLDRVRVVNIKTPIRLYELIALKEETTPEVKELLDIFARGLIEFEKQNWLEALKLFENVLEANLDDSPSKIYINRCKKFIKKSPPSNWDGVYNLTSK